MQHGFAAHIRHPDRNPPPSGVPSGRMDVYAGLVYQNIENFLARTFRVARRILSDAHWDAMVRDFIHRHVSGSPYFRADSRRSSSSTLRNERDTFRGSRRSWWNCVTSSGCRSRSTCPTRNRLPSLPEPPILDRSAGAFAARPAPALSFSGAEDRSRLSAGGRRRKRPTWLIGYRDEERAGAVHVVERSDGAVVADSCRRVPRRGMRSNRVAGELQRDPERIVEFGDDIIERLVGLGIVGVASRRPSRRPSPGTLPGTLPTRA